MFFPSANAIKLATVIGVFWYSNWTTIVPLLVKIVAKIPSTTAGALEVAFDVVTGFFVVATGFC